jgi:hypothetical protein
VQFISYENTRDDCKVRGLTLLLRVGTLWKCGDGLFFEISPLASDALLTTLHPLFENVLQPICRKLQEDSGTGGFDLLMWLQKPRNLMGRMFLWGQPLSPLEYPPYSPDLAPCDFWAFSIMKRELRSKKFRSDKRSAARFREVGGGASKKRPSPHLHKVSTRSNKVSPRTLQSSLVCDTVIHTHTQAFDIYLLKVGGGGYCGRPYMRAIEQQNFVP